MKLERKKKEGKKMLHEWQGLNSKLIAMKGKEKENVKKIRVGSMI